MSDYYPPLPEGSVFALDVILQNLAQDPEYLSVSPYSEEERRVLDQLGAHMSEIEDLENASDVDKWVKLERETQSLFSSLRTAGDELRSGDSAQQMAYFRTATALLEKLVGIQERTANLKQIHQFHNTVLSVMEDTLEPGQRTEVMARLKEAINADG